MDRAEVRTRTDRQTDWPRPVVAAWGRGIAVDPLLGKGPVGALLQGARRTAATHRRSEHVPNIYTFYVTYI